MYGGLGVKAQYMYALLLSVRVLVHEHGVDPIYGVTWTLIMIQGPYKTDKSTKGEAGGGGGGVATTTWVNHQHDPGRTRFLCCRLQPCSAQHLLPRISLRPLQAGRQAGRLAGWLGLFNSCKTAASNPPARRRHQVQSRQVVDSPPVQEKVDQSGTAARPNGAAARV